MSTARYAALLAVLLTIGLAAVANGATGDPLILGQSNSAGAPTGITSQFDTNVMSSNHLFVTELHPAATMVSFAAGEQVKSHGLGIGAERGGTASICQVQTPASTSVYVVSSHLSAAGDTVTARLSGPAPVATKVACMAFETG